MGMTANQLYLIRCVAENNLPKAKTAALACCAEDTTQKNKQKIAHYQNLLKTSSMNMIALPANITNFACMEDLSVSYRENRYYVTEEERKLFETIKKMHQVSLALMEKQIPYLNATLLYGESGIGKTAFSRYVAYKLNLPYLYINFSRMIESYLGNTSKNLVNLFNYINQNQCLVMLDEIDCIASSRKYGQGAEAELARSTTTLIQLLDAITNDHVIMAATNLFEEIDPAVKRRFTEKHHMCRLGREDRLAFIKQYFEDVGFEFNHVSAEKYADNDVSQAELVTHMIRSIADSLVKGIEIVIL